jgi:hypothetical protein
MTHVAIIVFGFVLLDMHFSHSGPQACVSSAFSGSSKLCSKVLLSQLQSLRVLIVPVTCN